MIRILVTEVAPGFAEGIRNGVSSFDDIEIVGYPRDGLEAAQMAVSTQPHVLLLNEQLPGITGLAVSELVSVAAPKVACALITEHQDEDTMENALRAGVRAIVTPSTGAEGLADIVRDLAKVSEVTQRREYDLATDPESMPQTVVFTAAKSGVGRSTLAANIGVVVANEFPSDAVLIDLCGQFSALPVLLDLDPSGGVMDLAGFVADMDIELVETFMNQHSSGLKVLGGGAQPDPSWMEILSVEFVARLLALLRREYRLVLCNLPPIVWPGGLYAISRCQLCLAVTNLWDLSGLNALSELVSALVPDYVADERLRIIVNRYDRNDMFDEEDLESALGRDIWQKIPNDTRTLQAAVNDSQTAVSTRPRSSFSTAIKDVADDLIDDLQAQVKATARQETA